MLNLINKFRRDEDGAVTVDWVVLTAALVGLGAIVIFNVSTGATSTANSVGNTVVTVGGWRQGQRVQGSDHRRTGSVGDEVGAFGLLR